MPSFLNGDLGFHTTHALTDLVKTDIGSQLCVGVCVCERERERDRERGDKEGAK